MYVHYIRYMYIRGVIVEQIFRIIKYVLHKDSFITHARLIYIPCKTSFISCILIKYICIKYIQVPASKDERNRKKILYIIYVEEAAIQL